VHESTPSTIENLVNKQFSDKCLKNDIKLNEISLLKFIFVKISLLYFLHSKIFINVLSIYSIKPNK
jgi:hypothetical protein